MINCTENFQSVLAFVLLYLQAVLDYLAAMLDVQTASLDFIFFVADSFHYLVRDVLDVAVWFVVHGSVNGSAVIVTEYNDKSSAEVLSSVLYTAELV